MAHGEDDAGEHGGEGHIVETCTGPCTVEERSGLPEAVDRLTIVTLGVVGYAKVTVRRCLQVNISAGRGEHKTTLTGGGGLVICVPEVEIGCLKDRDLSQPSRVVQGHCQGLSLTQNCQNTSQVARRQECGAHREPQIDGLLVHTMLLRQMRESTERLLEGPHGLAVGRPCQGLLPSLLAVRYGLIPHLTS